MVIRDWLCTFSAPRITNRPLSTSYSLTQPDAMLWSSIKSEVGSGGENYAVAVHMLRRRGVDQKSMITGASIHNQTIERLWRDVHQSVTIL